MAAMTKETLAKHHFWILIGITPILVLIAVIMISSSVGAEIDKKTGEIKSATDALKGKENPKSEAFLSRFNGQIEVLGRKRTDLWKENWERQIGLTTRMVGNKETVVQDSVRNLLRWPRSPKLNGFNYTAAYATDKNQLKFGDKIPDDEGEDQEFKKPNVYLVEFSNAGTDVKDIGQLPLEKRTGMADRVYPTTFAGGWENVLRHVNDWGNNKIRSELLWLALEDIWVQRAMLGSIKSVNDQIGAFVKTTRYENNVKAEETLLERAFESRVWYLTLKATQRPGDGRYVLSGTIRNKTDRLQLLGNNNTMVLNVWLSRANDLPVQFKIGGEFVPGGATVPIAQSEEHVLPPATPVDEIVKVEQVFDTRTVPIRRIERLALGKTDSRYAAQPLKMPLFKQFEKDEEAAKAGGASGSPSGMPLPMSSAPSSLTAGKDPSAGAAQGQSEGGGDVPSVLDSNRKRYVDQPTTQVRRMPVAICVVVDQAYIQDVLLAYANSPMRFQITQWHWQRFRGTLGDSGSGGSGPGSDDIAGPARGYEGSGGIRFGAGSIKMSGPRPGLPGAPTGGTPGLPMSGPSPLGPGGPGFPFGGDSGSLTTISEGQLTAGLVELTIYGIVSLYEKYTETPAAP
jgi:hypothetical protein